MVSNRKISFHETDREVDRFETDPLLSLSLNYFFSLFLIGIGDVRILDRRKNKIAIDMIFPDFFVQETNDIKWKGARE